MGFGSGKSAPPPGPGSLSESMGEVESSHQSVSSPPVGPQSTASDQPTIRNPLPQLAPACRPRRGSFSAAWLALQPFGRSHRALAQRDVPCPGLHGNPQNPMGGGWGGRPPHLHPGGWRGLTTPLTPSRISGGPDFLVKNLLRR